MAENECKQCGCEHEPTLTCGIEPPLSTCGQLHSIVEGRNIWIDTNASENGDGTAERPYDNYDDAIKDIDTFSGSRGHIVEFKI